MIELDIFWDSHFKKVLISHGQNISPKINLLCSVPITLEAACEQIAEFVAPNISPVFLMLEVNLGTDIEAQNQAAQIIESTMGRYLVGGNIDLRMTFPEHYMGKVLIASGGGLNYSSRLFNIVNVKFAQEDYLLNRSYNSVVSDQIYYGGLLIAGNVVRSYPSNIYLSKNFNPSIPFDLGVQFISMNYQTRDDYMKDYQRRFEGQSMVGYLPKKGLI
jgi:hypothetical protein